MGNLKDRAEIIPWEEIIRFQILDPLAHRPPFPCLLAQDHLRNQGRLLQMNQLPKICTHTSTYSLEACLLTHCFPGASNTRNPKLWESPECNLPLGKGDDGLIAHTCQFHLSGVMSDLQKVLGAAQRTAPVQLRFELTMHVRHVWQGMSVRSNHGGKKTQWQAWDYDCPLASYLQRKLLSWCQAKKDQEQKREQKNARSSLPSKGICPGSHLFPQSQQKKHTNHPLPNKDDNFLWVLPVTPTPSSLPCLSYSPSLLWLTCPFLLPQSL